MTVPELFVRGGPVVWVLAVWSVLGLAIVLERWLHFLRMGRSPVRTRQPPLFRHHLRIRQGLRRKKRPLSPIGRLWNRPMSIACSS